MSQAKVDRYKESKKNRKAEVQKARRNKMLATTISTIVILAVVVWIGYSGYTYFGKQKAENQTVTTTEVNTDAITDYMGSLE